MMSNMVAKARIAVSVSVSADVARWREQRRRALDRSYDASLNLRRAYQAIDAPLLAVAKGLNILPFLITENKHT